MERGLPDGWRESRETGANQIHEAMTADGARAPLNAETIEAFVRENARLMTPPLVPGIKLYLAEESVPIWQKTEDELGEMNVPPPFWAFAWAGGQALARYLLDNPSICARRRVIDLGAGR